MNQMIALVLAALLTGAPVALTSGQALTAAGPAVVTETVAQAPDLDLTGVYTAVGVSVDGEAVDFDAQRAAWPVLFGSDDPTVVVEGTEVSLFGAPGAGYTPEDGGLALRRGPIAGAPEGFYDRVIVPADGGVEVRTLGMAVFCEREKEPSPFEGAWEAVYIATPALQGDPLALWGLSITLTLGADGQAALDYIEPGEPLAWVEENGEAVIGDGTPARAVATLGADGVLTYTAATGDLLLMRRANQAE